MYRKVTPSQNHKKANLSDPFFLKKQKANLFFVRHPKKNALKVSHLVRRCFAADSATFVGT